MIATLFVLSKNLLGQGQTDEVIVYPIVGPYDEYRTAPIIYIKTKVHFSANWSSGWLEEALQARVQGIFSNLNQAFNPHGIYFLAEDNPCNTPNGFTYHPFDSDVVSSADIGTTSTDWLNICDYGPTGNPFGSAIQIPNNFLEVTGTDLGNTPPVHAAVLIHEVGHCLGLAHTHHDDGCHDDLPGCEDPIDADCNCCKDYVCDTDLNSDNGIQADPNNCSHPTLPENIVRNYMSYVTPGYCRDLFTDQQVMRMRAYLQEAPILQPIQLENTTVPANAPSSISGHIIVEEDYTISSPLEMLPGATIRVKKGATLRVQSTITGACGQMWQGVIVEGTTFGPQTTTYQGKILVSPQGTIEHARVAIEAQDINAFGIPIGATGGGIVTISGGKLINNIIGIRFGSYVGSSVNVSKVTGATFQTTDDYRGGDEQPVYLDLTGISGLYIYLDKFRDLRTQCTSRRAIGIDAKNAGFWVKPNSVFENLDIGIRADQLHVLNGSYIIDGSTFINCYKSIVSQGTSAFKITGNTFKIKKPDACPSSTISVIGVQLSGSTAGFQFSRNTFEFNGTASPSEQTIGTDCIGLEAGLNNTIRQNTYRNLKIANRAMGDNGYADDGLLYLCNFHDEFTLLSSEPPIDYLVTEGVTEEGQIKQIQGEEVDDELILPTGNVFSDVDYTFQNFGQSIDYYYYDDDESQDPNYGFGWSGMIFLKPVNQPNGNCPDLSPPPCDPCTTLVALAELKADFFERRLEWSNKKASLPSITNSAELQAEMEAIRLLRLGMNKDGSRILRHYELDTALIEVDSIISWLERIETYATDLRLARHFFFTNDFSAFDTLWSQIPGKYELQDEALDEFDELEQVYQTVRPHLQSGGSLYKLPETITDSLHFWADWCSEPGFMSQVLLWRNGIQVETDCSEIGERAQNQKENSQQLTSNVPLKIYPNPAQDVIFIETGADFGEGMACLFDLQGREMLRQKINSSSISILQSGNLSPGIYFFKITTASGAVQFSKILISR